MTIGIIAEYNPFHNGHLYMINKIKEMYPNSTIVCVMSGNFTERGDVSIINKWKKTEIALNYGVDLVIELPFVYASQSSDYFAYGAIKILDSLKVDKLVFGSETNNIEIFNKLVDIQLNNKEYDKLVKEYMDSGLNYPTSMSKALKDIIDIKIEKPNDLLGLSYIKEIKKQHSNIETISIKRENDYNSLDLDSDIVSASAIRNGLLNNIDVKKYVPELTYKYLDKLHFNNNYFKLLKYRILTTDIAIYQGVDEGLKYRILKYINESNTLDELISKVKTKRYTYNKLNRMFIHILCSFTKEEASQIDIEYIRVLGFSDIGRKYLNKVKKESNIPIITGYSNIDSKVLDIEYRVNSIYALDDEEELIQRELKGPIKL
ncbi:MAG: nucleotidyltransferase [Bacilli bacterium]|nr:nucleotidyltransferase [Bacilli bacterium]